MNSYPIQIIGQGNSDAVAAQVDPTALALRTSLRPLEHGSLGQYSFGAATGLCTGIAAAGALFSLRWAPAAQAYLVLNRLTIAASVTTALAGTPCDVDVAVVRGFTAADSGGTTVAVAAAVAKKKTAMNASLVSNISIATTAALANGTGTPDINAAAAGAPTSFATAGSTGSLDLIRVAPGEDHPIVLAPNEGIRVRAVTAQSTGAAKFYVSLDWAEVAAF